MKAGVARSRGTCAGCGQPILPGQVVLRRRHLRCTGPRVRLVDGPIPVGEYAEFERALVTRADRGILPCSR